MLAVDYLTDLIETINRSGSIHQRQTIAPADLKLNEKPCEYFQS